MKKKKLMMLLFFITIIILFLGYKFVKFPVKFVVEPNVTEAHPGDIITYNVKIKAVRNLASMKFKIVIPDGLTFIEGEEVSGLKTKLNAAKAEFTESTKIFIVGASNYSSFGDTLLMTFRCSVNDDASGKKDISFILDEDDFFDTSDDMNNISVEYSNLGSTVNITELVK